MTRKATSKTLPDLLKLQQRQDSIPAIPVARAAQLAGIGRSTLYRKLKRKSKEFELVPHGRARWVSVRSVYEYREDNYRPSFSFDIRKAREQ